VLTADPMPKRLCPHCSTTARFLVEMSKNSHVDYRCDRCGAVWTQDRADPNKPPFVVVQPNDRAANN
jgi:uncharacterized Zn finger protein